MKRNKIIVNSIKKIKKIKPMNSVNNGPVRANQELYKELEFPFARTHDASFEAKYGGERTVDITAIFPDFEKDAYDEASYDFCVTDAYLNSIMESGTKVFYRLGQKIDHRVKKYDNKVPSDFKKWAVICEHIIRHYNEGWANGFYMNIEYWEIWNEPNLAWWGYSDDSELDDVALGWKREANAESQTWNGTRQQYYELYKITAKHLKKCFPNLKIGGPAIAGSGMEDSIWCYGFFDSITEVEKTPLDFYSWHIYITDPRKLKAMSEFARGVLDKYGYTETESILDEWNYINGWEDNKLIESNKVMRSTKGAALVAATMCYCQNLSVDMLMYYDLRPSEFNGVFDCFTHEPLKTFYVFKAFAEIRKYGMQTECIYDIEDIYALSAVNENGNEAVMICYYTDDENAKSKEIELIFANYKKDVKMYLLDDKNDMELQNDMRPEYFVMKPNTVIFIK